MKMAMKTSSGSRLSSTDPIEVRGPTALISTSLSLRSLVNSSSWRLVGYDDSKRVPSSSSPSMWPSEPISIDLTWPAAIFSLSSGAYVRSVTRPSCIWLGSSSRTTLSSSPIGSSQLRQRGGGGGGGVGGRAGGGPHLPFLLGWCLIETLGSS